MKAREPASSNEHEQRQANREGCVAEDKQPPTATVIRHPADARSSGMRAQREYRGVTSSIQRGFV